MFRKFISAVFVASLLSSFSVRAHHTALPEGMSETQASWLWGFHTIPASITLDNSPYWYSYPHTDVTRINNPAWTEVANKQIRPGAKAPVVLIMHGCSGIARGPTPYRLNFMKRGYAVFEPDSFARPERTCNRRTLYKRTEELEYALKAIRQLPWADSDRVVLMGISQGGQAVAQWDKPGFQSHIILSNNCSGNQPAAPENTPVLAVVGEKDPAYVSGSSCKVSRKIGGSESIVLADAPHGISEIPETQLAIENFLEQCCQ